MRISVIGLGYVGLITALGFAQKGNRVIGIDIDRSKVDSINKGISPVNENPLNDLLAISKREGTFEASTNYHQILGSDLTFICVGTPTGPNGGVNLDYVERAVMQISKVLENEDNHQIITMRSTVPPGTVEEFILPLLEKYSKKIANVDFSLAVNPEFLQEGKAWHCFNNPDRVIIGTDDSSAWDILYQVYEPFSAPVIKTDIKTAEMIKCVSNAFLATKISFMNEIGNICRRLDIDTYAVANGIGYDQRIGNSFLRAGIGFGGSCLPKDLEALICRSKELGYQTELLQAALSVNENQYLNVISLAKDKLGDLKSKKMAILGLAFKPGTDDVRGSLAVKIIVGLLNEGAEVKAYDPEAVPNHKLAYPLNIEYGQSAKEVVRDVDCIIIVTEWDEFKKEELYRGKLVIDGRRLLEPEKARQFCDYYGVCW